MKEYALFYYSFLTKAQRPVRIDKQQFWTEKAKSVPGFKLGQHDIMPLLYHWRHLGRSQVQNLAPARTICWGISMKNYPSYFFNLCGRCIGWPFTCFSCVRCNMSSINKRSAGVMEPQKTYQKETGNCFGRETNPRPTRWTPIGSPQAFSGMDLWR